MPISYKPTPVWWIKNRLTCGEAHEKNIAAGNHGEKRKMQSQPPARRRGRPFDTLNFAQVVKRGTPMAHGLRSVLERHEVKNGPKTASAHFRHGEEHETVKLVSIDGSIRGNKRKHLLSTEVDVNESHD